MLYGLWIRLQLTRGKDYLAGDDVLQIFTLCKKLIDAIRSHPSL